MMTQYVPRSACALCTKAASKDGGAEGEGGAENQQSGDFLDIFLFFCLFVCLFFLLRNQENQ